MTTPADLETIAKLQAALDRHEGSERLLLVLILTLGGVGVFMTLAVIFDLPRLFQ